RQRMGFLQSHARHYRCINERKLSSAIWSSAKPESVGLHYRMG
ncbi:MAG: hypothetical protein ACI8PT_002198, partial [Gammaproteobacteria bacterium]